MTIDFKTVAAAALLLAAFNFPCRAEDAPTTPPAAQAAPGETKSTPADVPRPSVTAKSTDTAAPEAAGDAPPRHHRHYAHRYYRHYAFWEPFPIFLPHLYHNHIVWSRVSWFH